MIDFTKLREKLDPDPGGEDQLRIRSATVQTMNADGTVDILLSGVTVPGVPRLDQGGWLATGAVVQVLTLRGAYLILGASQKGGRAVSAYLASNITLAAGQTSYTAFATTNILGVAFVAPPSGAVEVTVQGWLSVVHSAAGARSYISAWVATGSVLNAGSVVSAADDDRAAISENTRVSAQEYKYVNVSYPVTGLTPGNTYNATVGQRSDGNGTPSGAVNKRRVTVRPF